MELEDLYQYDLKNSKEIKPYKTKIDIDFNPYTENTYKNKAQAVRRINIYLKDGYDYLIKNGLNESNAAKAKYFVRAYSKKLSTGKGNPESSVLYQIISDNKKYGDEYVSKRLLKSNIPDMNDWLDIYLA